MPNLIRSRKSESERRFNRWGDLLRSVAVYATIGSLLCYVSEGLLSRIRREAEESARGAVDRHEELHPDHREGIDDA